MNINAAYELNGRAAPVRASDVAAAEFEAVYCEQFQRCEATEQEAVTEAAVLIRAAQKLATEIRHAATVILAAEMVDLSPARLRGRVEQASDVALESFLDMLLHGCSDENRRAVDALVSAAFTEAL